MTQVKLLRFWHHENKATLGVLFINEFPACTTLEPPWKENARHISCIPLGEYVAHRVFGRSTIGGMFIPETFQISDIPGRGGILFHIGNSVLDTRGCPLLGTSFRDTGTEAWVTRSRDGFKRFMKLLDGVQSFELSIGIAKYGTGEP